MLKLISITKTILKTLFVVLIAGQLAGCKSQKSAAGSGEGTTGSVVLPSSSSLQTRYTMLTESWKPWNDVEVGVKVKLNSPAKFNAAGKVWMKRGEWISMSVRMLGFEVATLWVDRDSVVAVDKFHKKYLSVATSSLLGGEDVTVADVQDLLMGRAFLLGKGTATTSNRGSFDLEQAPNGWYLLPRRQPERFSYGFLASLTANLLRGAVIEVNDYGSVTADYKDIFESRNCGWFAKEVTLETSRGKKLSATIQWDLNGAKFNAGVSRRCNIPADCEKIPLSDLNKLLKSF